MTPKTTLARLFCLLLAGLPLAQAAPAPASPPATEPAAAEVPSWETHYRFSDLGHSKDTLLLGLRNTEDIDFPLRQDRIATEASLLLEYTPSPTLIPVQSHLRVYLNDELMGTVPILAEQLGQKVRHPVTLDARLLGDFNRLRLEFVGHYAEICEDPAHSGLWVNIGRQSRLTLREQALGTANDLAFFPLPFFDRRERGRLELPVVLPAEPSQDQQRAAGILASYFGAQAGWRGATFPVSFELPPPGERPRPMLVFATNAQRPAFLADQPPVDGPTVAMIDHPADPFGKLLLVLGRDDADLVQAASALAVGNGLFRGDRVRVNQVTTLAPRQPYDAPNWMRTDRPVRFEELMDYPTQLQVAGLQPRPIVLNLNLPPDLFVWRNQGIPLETRYRYTPPPMSDDSHLGVSINDQFIDSIRLAGSDQRDSLMRRVRLDITDSDSTSVDEKVLVPALKVGDRNTLRFDFNFASKQGNAQRDRCQSFIPTNVQAAIDEDSTIDMSGYHHYMAMPNLRAFVRSGFPFSRMADLSETLVVVPPRAGEAQVGLLLDTLALLGAQIGYPALGLRLTEDWKAAAEADADLLVLAPLPTEVQREADLNLLLDGTGDWLRSAAHGDATRPWAHPRPNEQDPRSTPATQVEVIAEAPIGALIGLRSPFHAQRSIVAFLAAQPDDFALLRQALTDPEKIDGFAGAVTLVRSSGVSSHLVGDRYYVGSLPWWLLVWFHLSHYPILIALVAVLCVVLFAFLLWQALRAAAQRRLDH